MDRNVGGARAIVKAVAVAVGIAGILTVIVNFERILTAVLGDPRDATPGRAVQAGVERHARPESASRSEASGGGGSSSIARPGETSTLREEAVGTEPEKQASEFSGRDHRPEARIQDAPQEPTAVVDTVVGVPGEQGFETRLTELLEEADAQVQSELKNDPTLATVVSVADETSVSPNEGADLQPVSVDGIHGVPGEERFEAQLTAWLEEVDSRLREELSTDPTTDAVTR